MLILGIETSCDDTSVAVVEDGRTILANVVFRQHQFHQLYGGVVPEVAARKQVEVLLPTLEQALKKSQKTLTQLEAIAVTSHPGLIGSLLVGVNTAKTLAYALDKPLFAVNHLAAHLYALQMTTPITCPYVGLIVSGGHTLLTKVSSPLQVEVLGSTLDDACGECFDKVAKHYKLGYPGGARLEKTALGGDEGAYAFPSANLSASKAPYDFSYSGLKTAVVHHPQKYQTSPGTASKKITNLKDLAASFQLAAFKPLLKKSKLALKALGLRQLGICGGVSANLRLRQLFKALAATAVYFPPLSLCQDNAAMVAGLAYEQQLHSKGGPELFELKVSSRNFKTSKML